MPSFSVTKRIPGTSEEVFALFADIENAPQRVTSITKLQKLTDGPVGKGTRFRETRVFMNREATEEMEFTAFEPPGSYTVYCEAHGCRFSSVFEFIQDGDFTDVKVTFDVEATALMAKMMSPVAAFMLTATKKCVEQDMEDLRAVATSGRQAV